MSEIDDWAEATEPPEPLDREDPWNELDEEFSDHCDGCGEGMDDPSELDDNRNCLECRLSLERNDS